MLRTAVFVGMYMLTSGMLFAQVVGEFPYELPKDRAAEFLSLPEGWVGELSAGKESLNEEQFDEFRNQFGLLPNGMPSFQIGPNQYFVLLPLSQVDQQARVDVEANSAKLRDAISNDSTPPSNGNDGAGPDRLDHRPALTPIRNQGERGTCVAFASCAELEAIEKAAGRTVDLSENLAYWFYMREEGSTPCADPGLATFRAAGYLQLHLVAEENCWPYESSLSACPAIDTPPASVANQPGLGVKEFLHLPKGSEVVADGSIDIRDTKTLEALLQRGHNIVFGSVVAWKTSQAEGIIDVTLGPAGQPIFGSGGHAMLIVGYDRTGPKPFFIVKNSWGTGYGHDGYLFFSYDYLRTYGKYGYVTTQIRQGDVVIPQP